MNKLFEACDKFQTLLDLKRVHAAQRQEREPMRYDDIPVPAVEGKYWIAVYLTGRLNPIELEYPYDKEGRRQWTEDYLTIKGRRGPL